MRVVIAGGGPAGLFFAILMRQQDPSHEITVYERNRPDDTFGWGVVFSGKTRRELAAADPATAAALEPLWMLWEDVVVVHRGERVRIGGNHFAGIARITLLKVLQDRCRELGIDVRYGTEITTVQDLPEHDLLVAADGLRSLVRDTFKAEFQPDLELRPNRYIWLGTPQMFHALTLTFRTNRDGLFIAHSYKFSPELSTFIVECDPESWHAAGLDRATEAESLAYLEKVFEDDLAGRPLLSNQSRWIQFTTVRNRHWVCGKAALMGDAAHTAHFSIGSGTKLAMEDAVALAERLASTRSVPEALAAYEADR
nr:FAD-dependent monooxygenase [Thermoanaerobaculia bacterium]